jgi:hypothetical protein
VDAVITNPVSTFVDFQTAPSRYRHWMLSIDGQVATLIMDVQEDAGIRPGYKLKLNSCEQDSGYRQKLSRNSGSSKPFVAAIHGSAFGQPVLPDVQSQKATSSLRVGAASNRGDASFRNRFQWM